MDSSETRRNGADADGGTAGACIMEQVSMKDITEA